MEYRVLGRSGMTVSRLCLGTMMFGGAADAATSRRMIARAAEAGLTFLDTADVYNGGRSEELVGEALAEAGSRNAWILATKVANAFPAAGPHARGLSRRWLALGVEASLHRLRTDCVDLLYLHREDPDTPLEVTVSAVGDLIRAGKIRTFGLSNFRAWRVAALCEACDRLGVDRPVANQPLYNALNRQVEIEVIPASAQYGLGVVPYSPLARGVLTAKYAADGTAPPDSRAARGDKRLLETEMRPESFALAARLRAHAEAAGTAPSHLALRWVLNNAAVTAAVVGPRTEAQLEDALAALAAPYTPADETLLSGLVAPGHPSTPGYNDPQYPIEGRIPVIAG